MATRTTTSAQPAAPNYTVPFIIVTGLFLIFGFLTNLNSNLSPKLEDIFHLDHAWSNLVTSAWFFAYLVFSVPAAKVIEAVGYKRTMVISLFVMVVGALLFIPAAGMISFPFFLTASFVLATGVCGLQTSANPYVSILGPEHSAPARLTLAQAFNSLGTAMAPLVVGAFILTDPDKAMDQAAVAHTVQGPYIAIAIALLVLGFAVMMMHLPTINLTREFRPAADPGGVGGADSLAGRGIWSHRHTVLAMVGIFLYVGLEISLAANAIRFFNTQGIENKDRAALLASFYPFAMMIGRFAGTVVMKAIKAEKLLAFLGLLGVALAGGRNVCHGSAGHLVPDPVRARQLHHVSHDLCAGHCRAGTFDQQGLGRDYDRQRGRRRASAAVRSDRRQSGLPARISAAHRLLSLHGLLRRVGIQAGTQGCGLGILQTSIHQALRQAGGPFCSRRWLRCGVAEVAESRLLCASIHRVSCRKPRQIAASHRDSDWSTLRHGLHGIATL